jgi:predicted transcriptional regulator
VTTPTETERRAHAMTLRWPPELHDELRAVAERHERSLSAEIRVAVREHLEREANAGRVVKTGAAR